jgi:hypothetical protein
MAPLRLPRTPLHHLKVERAMADILYIVLALAVFAAFALAVRGAERM